MGAIYAIRRDHGRTTLGHSKDIWVVQFMVILNMVGVATIGRILLALVGLFPTRSTYHLLSSWIST